MENLKSTLLPEKSELLQRRIIKPMMIFAVAADPRLQLRLSEVRAAQIRRRRTHPAIFVSAEVKQMPKINKGIEFLTAILCDDVRREGNGKELLIGVYTGQVLLPEMPQDFFPVFWVPFETLDATAVGGMTSEQVGSPRYQGQKGNVSMFIK